MKELLLTMDACIGAAAAYYGYGFPQYSGQRVFNDGLHTQGVVLALPAGIARSDIRNLEEIAHITLTLARKVKGTVLCGKESRPYFWR